jgi:hypothetical protein
MTTTNSLVAAAIEELKAALWGPIDAGVVAAKIEGLINAKIVTLQTNLTDLLTPVVASAVKEISDVARDVVASVMGEVDERLTKLEADSHSPRPMDATLDDIRAELRRLEDRIDDLDDDR